MVHWYITDYEFSKQMVRSGNAHSCTVASNASGDWLWSICGLFYCVLLLANRLDGASIFHYLHSLRTDPFLGTKRWDPHAHAASWQQLLNDCLQFFFCCGCVLWLCAVAVCCGCVLWLYAFGWVVPLCNGFVLWLCCWVCLYCDSVGWLCLGAVVLWLCYVALCCGSILEKWWDPHAHVESRGNNCWMVACNFSFAMAVCCNARANDRNGKTFAEQLVIDHSLFNVANWLLFLI